ncbi:MAG: hypothetical protein GDA44_09210 [Prochloron sp. SP5CPC1]|nr:hypothetical protein [Candidatus Paraprochloron terpiosi SP5CPC1]
MITQFRSRYPHGSLISELVKIDHGNYVVRAAVQVEDVILATGLAAASTVEVAEDKARNRALALLDLEGATEFVRGGEDIKSSTSQENHLEEEEVKQWEQLSTPENAKVPRKETKSVLSTPDYPSKEEVNSSAPDDIAKVPHEETKSVPSTPDDTLLEEVNSPTPVGARSEPTTLDFSEIMLQIDEKMKRLGWNKEQGKIYLLETYGKRSRHLLNDEELLGFLAYLQTLPTPS